MTREEAIEILWRYDVNFEPHPPEEVMHAIDMAIEALEGKDTNVPTKDCISRQDAIEAVRKLKIVEEDNKNYPDYAYNAGIETAIKTIELMLSADAEKYIKECNTKTHDLVHRDVIKPKLVDCTDFVLWLLEEIMDEGNWEMNAVADGEIIARKLKKLGLLEVKGGYYVRTPSADANWIPCSERFPDAEYGEGDSVLCCTETGLMHILYWDGGNWCVPTGEPHQWVNHKTGWHDKVIAWMPLPEPYKDGEA